MVNENQAPVPPAYERPAGSLGARSGAGLLTIAGIIVVGGHVLFGIVMGEFTYGNTPVATALLLLMSILWSGFGIGSGLFQRALGYFLGLSALVSLISDMRFGFPDGAVDNFANLVFYAGAAIAFLGAYRLRD